MTPTKSLFRSLLIPLLAGAAATSCTTTGEGVVVQSESSRAERARQQIDDADAAFDARAYDQALSMYQGFYTVAKDHDPALQAEVAAQIATVYATTERVDMGDPWMETAENVAREGDELAWSRLLLARGMRSYARDDERSARGHFTALYHYCELHGLTPRAMQAAMLVSLVTIGEDQLDWSLRSIAAAQNADRPAWESDGWSTHGWLLDDRGRHDDALRAFERARELALEAAVTRIRRIRAAWEHAHGLRMVGRYEEARELLSETIGIARSVYFHERSRRAAEHLGRAHWEMAEVMVALGREKRGREHFVAARDKLIEAGAQEAVPALVEELDERIRRLDDPEPERRIPPRRSPNTADDPNGGE